MILAKRKTLTTEMKSNRQHMKQVANGLDHTPVVRFVHFASPVPQQPRRTMKNPTARTPKTRKPDTITPCRRFTPADMGSQKPRPPTWRTPPAKHPWAVLPNSPAMQTKNKGNCSCWLSGNYATDYIVTLSGVADATAGQVLRVNHSEIPLNPSEYLIMLILVCHSLQTAGTKVPVEVTIFPFLSADEVARAVEGYCKGANTTSISRKWDGTAVSRRIYTVRRKLRQRKLNRCLIQNDIKGRGLRLGTQPVNVTLIYLDQATQKIIRIDGSDLTNSTEQE